MSEIEETLNQISDGLGVGLTLRETKKDSGFLFEIGVLGLVRPIAFDFGVKQSLLSWSVVLNLHSFPGDMLRVFGSAFQSRNLEIRGSLAAVEEEMELLKFHVNGKPILDVGSAGWEHLELETKIRFLEIDQSINAFRRIIIGTLCLLIPLFTEDASQIEEISLDEEMFKEEGASRRVARNFYERSRINRALCLDYFGFTCLGCGLIMNHKYGQIGENVIEVHHLIPVSAMGESKIVNPIKDLVPLCPNCHTIVHRTNPPSSLEQLQKWTEYNPIKNSKNLHNGKG